MEAPISEAPSKEKTKKNSDVAETNNNENSQDRLVYKRILFNIQQALSFARYIMVQFQLNYPINHSLIVSRPQMLIANCLNPLSIIFDTVLYFSKS